MRVKRYKIALAYIARFREVTYKVRKIRLLGVSLIDIANKFIKGIKPWYSDINKYLFAIRYSLETKLDNFLDITINILKSLKAEGATKYNSGGPDENKSVD